MLMVTDSERQNGARGARGDGARKRKRKRARGGIAIHTKSILFVPRRPGIATTAAVASASSPNFVANLRATKSAPFDFTLIRCRCRAVDEANLPLRRVGTERDFIFRGPRHSYQVCFKVTAFLLSAAALVRPSPSPSLPLVPVFLSALLARNSSRWRTFLLSYPGRVSTTPRSCLS